MLDLKNVNATSTMTMIAGGMKNMNSLTKRLKPEAAAKLQEASKEFPYAIGAIMDELNIYVSILDLKYGTVISLSNFLDLRRYDIVELLTQFEES
jgi:hypothetical protein